MSCKNISNTTSIYTLLYYINKYNDNVVLFLNNTNLYKFPTGKFSEYILSNIISINLNSNNLMSLKNSYFSLIPKLQMLYLSNNNIFDIGVTTFMNNTDLQEISLNNNKLNNIKTKLFKYNIRLEKIYLQNNLITNLKSGTFIENYRLTTLDISNNKLKLFTNIIFNFNLRLIYLNISYNSITSMNGQWHNLDNVEILNINNNLLTKLSMKIFDLKSLKNITIHNNLFTCGCDLKWILKYNITFKINNDGNICKGIEGKHYRITDFLIKKSINYHKARLSLSKLKCKRG